MFRFIQIKYNFKDFGFRKIEFGVEGVKLYDIKRIKIIIKIKR